MKRLILLAFSIFFLVNYFMCFAQAENEKPNYEYEPLVQDGAWWFRLVGCSGVSSYDFSYFDGDTVINGTTYNVFHNSEVPPNHSKEFFKEIDKKVFKYDVYQEKDFLIYDFSKSVGDTMFQDNGIGSIETCILNETNYVNLCNDKKKYIRKHYFVKSTGWPPCGEDFERIGDYDKLHPFVNKASTTCFYWLKAFGVKDEIIYGEDCEKNNNLPHFDSMQELEAHLDTTYVVVANQIINYESINISPNPVHDSITIESNLPINLINIFSIDGKRLLQFKNETDLDISSLSKGIYIVSLSFENGEVVSQKIIKQ